MDNQKRHWELEVEQNGGEYTSFVLITAENVEWTHKTGIIADGVEIDFGETINSIEVVF